MPSDIGKNIKAARAERGWSQEDLAARVGAKLDTLRKLEQGTIEQPRNLKVYAEALGWSEAELRFGRAAAASFLDTSTADPLPRDYEDWIADAAKRHKLSSELTGRLRAFTESTFRSIGMVEEDDVFRKAKQLASGSASSLFKRAPEGENDVIEDEPDAPRLR